MSTSSAENTHAHQIRHRKWPWLLLAAALIVIACVWFSTADIRNVNMDVVLEAGEELSPELFFREPDENATILADLSAVNTAAPGRYTIPIRTRFAVVQATLTVRDTVAPTADAQALQVFLGNLPEPAEFISGMQDETSVSASYSQQPNVNTPGEQTGVVLLTDAAGNRTEIDISLTVIADTAAPVISGVADRSVFLGDAADLLSGVTASDDYDENPALTVDDGGLDHNTAGVYTVTYTATDFSGNTAVRTAAVTVIADTTAPVISGAVDRSVFLGDAADVLSGVTVSDDYDENPALTVDDGGLDHNTAGVYTVVYTATDFSGNTAVETAAVTVISDTIAPMLSGVRDISIYAGQTADYISDVVATDDYDPDPQLVIDDSEFDPETPGEYTVTYIAQDFSGNAVSATAKIMVLDDTEGPVISGLRDYKVFVGDSVNYLSGVTVSDNRDPNPVLTIDDPGVDFSAAGKYIVKFTASDDFGNVSTAAIGIIVQKDNEAPVISGVQDYEVYVGDTVDFVSGVTVSDNRDSELTIEIDNGGVDFNVPKTYTVAYSCTDSSGNTAKARARIRVKRDTTAPVIEGAQDIKVEVGGTVSYRKGVSVTDNHDPSPTLTIDNSAVNLNKIGRYKVKYTAEDSSGNAKTVTIRVEVTRKQLTEEHVDMIWPMADEILAQIITDDMTPMEKGFKIYEWCRRNIRYSGTSDKSHWVMGAYDAFTSRSGDCFNYFAAAKALLTRAGIPNVDVIKNENQYSRHFWSLVDVGGGWYHFDSCPFEAGDDDFYLLTDAELAYWDRTHRGAHPFDAELYPERATESVQKYLNYYKYEVKE